MLCAVIIRFGQITVSDDLFRRKDFLQTKDEAIFAGCKLYGVRRSDVGATNFAFFHNLIKA